jgi:hypothetical protein
VTLSLGEIGQPIGGKAGHPVVAGRLGERQGAAEVAGEVGFPSRPGVRGVGLGRGVEDGRCGRWRMLADRLQLQGKAVDLLSPRQFGEGLQPADEVGIAGLARGGLGQLHILDAANEARVADLRQVAVCCGVVAALCGVEGGGVEAGVCCREGLQARRRGRRRRRDRGGKGAAKGGGRGPDRLHAINERRRPAQMSPAASAALFPD